MICLFSSCAKESQTSSSSGVKVGSLSRFISIDNYLYVLNDQNLQTYDISNPSQVNLVSNLGLSRGLETIYYLQNTLFIGSETGMKLIDITNRSKPQFIAEAIEIRQCDPVVAIDSIAYSTRRSGPRCGNSANVLIVYNVKNLSQPIKLNTITLKSPYGLDYKDQVLYVCDENQIIIYNISNPTLPLEKARIKQGGVSRFSDVISYNNSLFVYHDRGLSIYDITNPLDPIYLSNI